jgi:hypothetical protein
MKGNVNKWRPRKKEGFKWRPTQTGNLVDSFMVILHETTLD